MLNKAILTGRLTATPELKKTTNGKSVAQIRIAVQRNFKATDGSYPVDFLNLVVWNNTAEFVCKHFAKGDLITVVGSIQTRTWTNDDGDKRISVEVVADECLFAGTKAKEEQKEFTPPTETGGNDTEFEDVTDEQLPF